MSRQAVQAVIHRAMTDSEFRQELFAKPHQALTEYDLTEAEVAALRTIDVETLESLARRPDEHSSDSLVIGLYTGMLAANRQQYVPRGKDLSGLEEDVPPRDGATQVAVRNLCMDLEESTRKEVRKMKRWQILVTVVAMTAVGLAGYAVGASRQATDIAVAVESELARRALAARVIPGHDENYNPGGAPNYVPAARKVQPSYTGYDPSRARFDPWIYNFQYMEELDEEWVRALAAKEASADAEVELDYTEGGAPENNFYQPIKPHIDWDIGDPDPWD